MSRETARRPLGFERFSEEHGPSQSIVSCLLVDRRGFLWLGTEDGLNRYDGYEFRVFRHANEEPGSLSYSEVRCLLESRRGECWAGTFQGLNRFDEATESFERYLHRNDDPASLAEDVVEALAEDRDGGIWVATEGGGLDLLDPATGAFHHHRHDPDDPDSLADDEVTALTLDAEGRLWIGTAHGLDDLGPGEGRFRHHRHDPGDPESLVHPAVTSLLLDRRDRLWVGTRGGLDRLDRQTGAFVHYTAGPGGLADNRVSALCEDDDGRLWVGLDGGGLDNLDPATGRVDHHRHDPREPTTLPTDRVFSCCRDGSGVLWVGTYGAGGLAKADPRKSRFAHYCCRLDDPRSLVDPIVWSMWEEPDGTLWVGTDGGLDRIDPSSGEVRHFLPDPDDPGGLVHHGVRVVYVGPSGHLWVGTNGGLQRLDRSTGRFERWVHDPGDPASLRHDEIRSLLEDGDGALWIGTLGGGLNRFQPPPPDPAGGPRPGVFTAWGKGPEGTDPDDPGYLGSDFVRPLYDDGRGRLWVGTQGVGLACLDRVSGRWRHLRHDAADPRSLASDHVFALWEDDEARIWVATYAGGLDCLDPETGHARRWGVADGLPANLVYGLLGDDDGNLWLSSNKGLTRFEPASGRFRTWGFRDGLQANEFNGGSFHRGPSGRMFFGGINGFNAFDPGTIRDSDYHPRVVLTDLQVAGRSLGPGQRLGARTPLSRSLVLADSIELTHRDRVVSFQFAALDLSSPAQIRYAYRLEGFDPEWRTTDAARRFATYTNLPAGRYQLRVRATNCDGLWSPHEAAVAVEVAPPFWGTWWFRGAVAATLAAIASRSYRRRVRTVRLETELLAAREAQRSIWPQADPVLPGYGVAAASYPASEVGGDFFDFIGPGAAGDPLWLAVGDVSGKGMRAAMSAVLSSGMTRAMVRDDRSPEETLRALNHAIREKTPARSFTALCLARLEAGNGRLTWANAGLPEPMVRSGDGVRFLETADPRLPLGVQADLPYRQETAVLEPGDVLVLYSDGLPEARGRDGQPYGYDRARERLATLEVERMTAREILDALVSDARASAASEAPADDLTLVVVRREPA